MAQEHVYCTFGLAGRRFGLEVSSVREVLRRQEIVRVPLAPREVAGLLNLRGEVVMAIDLRCRLGLEDRADGAAAAIVVVHSADGPVGYVIDEIGEVSAGRADRFEPPPETLRGGVRELIRGAYKMDGHLLLVLDHSKLEAVGGDSPRAASADGSNGKWA